MQGSTADNSLKVTESAIKLAFDVNVKSKCLVLL